MQAVTPFVYFIISGKNGQCLAEQMSAYILHITPTSSANIISNDITMLQLSLHLAHHLIIHSASVSCIIENLPS